MQSRAAGRRRSHVLAGGGASRAAGGGATQRCLARSLGWDPMVAVSGQRMACAPWAAGLWVCGPQRGRHGRRSLEPLGYGSVGPSEGAAIIRHAFAGLGCVVAEVMALWLPLAPGPKLPGA